MVSIYVAWFIELIVDKKNHIRNNLGQTKLNIYCNFELFTQRCSYMHSIALDTKYQFRDRHERGSMDEQNGITYCKWEITDVKETDTVKAV